MREILPWIPARNLSIKEGLVREQRRTYVTVVVTLTLFSHSNSVHILRNLYYWSARRPGFIETRTYLSFSAVRRLNVVHDINVDVIQDDALLGHSWSLPQDASKDDTSFCRRNLNGSLDTLEAMRSDGIDRRPLHELQIAQSRKI